MIRYKKLDRDVLLQSYSQLGTIKLVAEHFEISPSTMERAFRRFDIPYIKKHKNKFNETFFSNNTAESFYLAGFIAADGNVSSNKYVLKIELSDKNSYFLEEIAQLIKFEGKLFPRVVKNSLRNPNWNDTKNQILKCSSKQIVTDLKKFNIVPNKTKTYKFPEWLKDHELVNHFMRGYFDGDGHLGIRIVHGKYIISEKMRFSLVGNFEFLKVYQEVLMNKCNAPHNWITERQNGLCCLEYSGNIVVPKICEFLYNNSTFHLDRKYEVYKSFLEGTNDKKSVCYSDDLRSI